MKLKNICIMGTLRSGKTLVSRALNIHPYISVQVEPYFFFFKICRNIFYRDILKDDIDPESPISSGFANFSGYTNLFNEKFNNLQFKDSDIKELIKKTTWQQEYEDCKRAPLIVPMLHSLRPGSAKEVLNKLMKILAVSYQKENLQYIGISEGWCDEFIAPLTTDLHYKCIHIIRDPRAIIASRNYGLNINEKYGGKYPILFLIRHWRKSVSYSILNKNNPNYLSIRYEDIVENPEYWFDLICKHLDVYFDENILRPDKYINGCNNFWKQNTSFKVESGFSTSAINRWESVLSKEDVSLIEYLCKPEMHYYKYINKFEDCSTSNIVSYKENSNDIVDWLKQYNLYITEDEIKKEIMRLQLLDLPVDYVSDSTKKSYFYDDCVYDSLLGLNNNNIQEHL
mgnify:FL=1